MKPESIGSAVADFRQAMRTNYPTIAFGFQVIAEDLPDLFPEEAALLSPNAVQKRRSEFQAGRNAARLALRQLGAAPVAIGKGAMGEPVWPNGVLGSITHTEHLAMAAACTIGTYKGIGLDLELDQRFKPELASAILTDAELQCVKNGHGDIGAYFSAKEATYKAIFGAIGKVIGFQDVELDLTDDNSSFAARPKKAFSPQFQTGITFLNGKIFKSTGMILSFAVFS